MGATIMNHEDAQRLLRALGAPETPEYTPQERAVKFDQAVMDWFQKVESLGESIHHTPGDNTPPESNKAILETVKGLLGQMVATGAVSNVAIQFETVHGDFHTIGVCTGGAMVKFCLYLLDHMGPEVGVQVALKYIQKVMGK